MKSLDPTADRLLLTARRLFGEHGYAGASIRQITIRAHANLGAVTYHYGSKEQLYHAVLKSIVEPMAARMTAAARDDRPPLDRIERLIRAFFDHFAEHPDFPQFMTQMLIQSGPFPPPVVQAQGVMRDAFLRTIEAGQREGSIRPGPPLLLALNVIAQPVYVALARRAILQVTGLDPVDPGVREQIIREVVAFARRGLAAASGVTST
jgi:AcrR family transcriptional regulator